MTAPIVLFTYERLQHTRRTVEALANNPLARDSDLVVYSDGARTENSRQAVDEVRSYLKGITGFRSLSIIERERNYGLAGSIIDGVSSVLKQSDRIIVLEDDIITAPCFLDYMNAALDCYADDRRVASVHGYCYPVATALPPTFFLRGADCWGWATWARAWSEFEPDGARLLDELRTRRLTQAFDLDGTYPFTKMLADQVAGLNNSWAIRWHASCFLKDMLTLYPGRSLVDNIGNDSSGTHCGTTDAYAHAILDARVDVARIEIEPDSQARAAFASFFRHRQSRFRRFRQAIQRAFFG